MRLLLDTHILLWALFEPNRLGSARDPIGDTGNEVGGPVAAEPKLHFNDRQGLARHTRANHVISVGALPSPALN